MEQAITKEAEIVSPGSANGSLVPTAQNGQGMFPAHFRPSTRPIILDRAQFNDAVEIFKRTGLLGVLAVQSAISTLGANPNDQMANETLARCLAWARAHEAQFGKSSLNRPPASGAVDGFIRLGACVGNSALNQVGLLPQELAQNIIVAGMQGSGKSNFLKGFMLSNLDNPMLNFWEFTKKTDERGLLLHSRRPLVVLTCTDPFSHPNSMGLKPERHASTLASAFTFSNNIWLGPEAVLTETITRLYEKIKAPPTWKEIRGYIKAIRSNDRSMREYLASLDIKIGYLIQAFGTAFDKRRGVDLRTLLNTHAIFEIPLDCPPEVRRFHVLHILLWAFNFRRAWFQTLTEEQIRQVPILVCVLDDAHEFFCAEQERARKDSLPPFYELVTCARACKMALVVATHTPEGLSKVLWDCHGTTVCFRLPGKASRDKVAEVF